MNQLSILDPHLEDYSEKLQCYAEKTWMYNHFRVGEKADYFSTLVYANILCNDNCELINYIDKKLTDLSDECDKKKHFCHKLKTCSEKHDCSESEACDNIITSKW